MSKRTIMRTRLRYLALLSTSIACSKGEVDLGGDTVTQDVERGSQCSESTILAENVSVADQDDLDALLGCEEVHGDLVVKVFEGTDLRPLRRLRVVDGLFHLGAIPGSDVDFTTLSEAEAAAANVKIEHARAVVEAGWLPSLEGVESLEHVGTLALQGLSAPDLRAFESLRGVGTERLIIGEAKNLVDLSGLEQVPQFADLDLRDNPSLQSLDGLQVATHLQQVSFQGDPLLADIGALSSVESVEGIVYLVDTGIRNLDALSHLGAAFAGVALSENAQLTQVDALATNLRSAQSLVFVGNPKLERLPAFPLLMFIDSFHAVENAELRAISLVVSNSHGVTIWDTDEVAAGRANFAPTSGVINIIGNPKLETLTVEAGFTAAEALTIDSNVGLVRLDLGSLQRLDSLQINSNASLTNVTLGDLQTVASLTVSRNPRLDPSELRNVRSFESTFSGNSDDPAP